MSASAAAAVAKLATQLAKIGYAKWESSRAAKQHLVAILKHMQDELERNYRSLQAARAGSVDERLEWAVHDAGIEAVSQALQKETSLVSGLRSARNAITNGMQMLLTRPLVDEVDIEAAAQLWRLTGRASALVDEWLERNGGGPGKPHGADCEPKLIGDLLAGWPDGEKLRILSRWKGFKADFANVRRYTLDEVQVTTMYHEPDREVRLREAAMTNFPDRHSFELVAGVHEYWLSPRIRVLFAVVSEGPRELDVCDLSGRDVEGWTPRWLVRRAGCRLETLIHPPGLLKRIGRKIRPS